MKNRVYESHSTSRSGGTGEPNYADLKRRTREFCMLNPKGENKKNSTIKITQAQVHTNLYHNKISALTKENALLKSDYDKVQKQISEFERDLEKSKNTLEEKENTILSLNKNIEEKDQKIAEMKKHFQTEREADTKIVTEYINAENYLLELVDEFTNGMRKIYANDIEFKDVDIDGLPF